MVDNSSKSFLFVFLFLSIINNAFYHESSSSIQFRFKGLGEDRLTSVDELIRMTWKGHCASCGILLCWLGTLTAKKLLLSFSGLSRAGGFEIRLSSKILIKLIDDRPQRLFLTFRTSL